MDPREIEAWPATLLAEFKEYELLEPFGQWRDNYHAAMIAWILASVHRDPKRKPPALSDFMYQDAESAKIRQEQDTVAFFRGLKKAGNNGR